MSNFDIFTHVHTTSTSRISWYNRIGREFSSHWGVARALPILILGMVSTEFLSKKRNTVGIFDNFFFGDRRIHTAKISAIMCRGNVIIDFLINCTLPMNRPVHLLGNSAYQKQSYSKHYINVIGDALAGRS